MLKIFLTRGRSSKAGVWLSLPFTPADVGRAYSELDYIMGEKKPNTHIAGVESSIMKLQQYLEGKSTDDPKMMNELNFIAQRLDGFTESETRLFSGAMDIEAIGGLTDIINLTYSLEEYEIYSGVTTTEELGRYLVERGIVHNDKRDPVSVDFEKIGHEYESNHRGVYTTEGYVVKTTNNRISQIYDGKTLPNLTPVPEYIFKLQIYPPNLQGMQRKQFTLKLPVSKAELEQMLAEFGEYDFGECDFNSCESHVKSLSNTLNIGGDIYKLNELANYIKTALEDQKSMIKILAVLEEERPKEVSEALEIVTNLDRYELLPQTIITPSHYARHVLFESGRYKINSEVKDFIDLRKYGNYKMEEDGVRQSAFGMLRRTDEPFKDKEQDLTQQMGGM